MGHICIYHSGDLDGKCSAAIVLRKYPDAELFPYDYEPNVDVQQFKGRQVIMVDVSFPMDKMLELAQISSLTWIDHHKTAINDYLAAVDKLDYASLIDTMLIVGRAACELTWDKFFPGLTPHFIHLLGRYDVWDFSHGKDEIMNFQYGMKVQDCEPTSKLWDSLFFSEELLVDIEKQGCVIQKYAEQTNRDLCRNAFEVTFDNLKCICLNTTGRSSLVFNSVWDNTKYDAMLAFYLTKKDYWTMSMYTDKPGVDVSEVAKRRGGGGHMQAAGFRTKTLPPELAPGLW